MTDEITIMESRLPFLNIKYPPAPMVGCTCDANYYNSGDGKWYSDAGFTELATDDSIALQNLINHCHDGLYPAVFYIPNNINLESTVSIVENLTIFGKRLASSGWKDGASIVTNATSLTSYFRRVSELQADFHYFEMYDLSFYGYNKVQYGIYMTGGGEGFHVHDVAFRDFTVAGIYVYGDSETGRFDRILGYNCKSILLISGMGANYISGISGDSNEQQVYIYQFNGNICLRDIKCEDCIYGVRVYSSSSSSIIIDNIRYFNNRRSLCSSTIFFEDGTNYPSFEIRGLYNAINEVPILLTESGVLIPNTNPIRVTSLKGGIGNCFTQINNNNIQGENETYTSRTVGYLSGISNILTINGISKTLDSNVQKYGLVLLDATTNHATLIIPSLPNYTIIKIKRLDSSTNHANVASSSVSTRPILDANNCGQYFLAPLEAITLQLIPNIGWIKI